MRTKTPAGSAETETLRKRAADLLIQRPLSSGLLEEKLTAWGGTPQQARETVNWLLDIGLLDDGEYAKAVARHYQRKGYGLYKIKDELCRRKVPREYWEDALAELDEFDEIKDRLLAARLEDPTDRKQLKKASDALARRGFSWSQISEALNRYRCDWDES